LLPAGEDRFGLPRLISFSEKNICRGTCYGPFEIEAGKEEKRYPSKLQKKPDKDFLKNYFQRYLQNRPLSLGLVRRENAEISKLSKRADEKS